MYLLNDFVPNFGKLATNNVDNLGGIKRHSIIYCNSNALKIDIVEAKNRIFIISLTGCYRIKTGLNIYIWIVGFEAKEILVRECIRENIGY